MDGNIGLVLRALHILGAIAWVGGILAAGLVVALANEDARRGAAEAARKVSLYVAAPGMIVTWIVGLSVLIPNFAAFYAKAGWMHGKLTTALIATALTGVLSGQLRKIAKGEEAKPGMLRGLAIGVFVLAAIIVFLVRFQPGGTG